MKIVLATHNPGKIRELQKVLSGLPVELLNQADLAIPEAEENGLSFVENALLKARQVCRASGLPAIADDSGLVVPALKGAPGIYSARYAGPEAKAEANIEKLLDELKAVPLAERQASFHCCLVYLAHEKDPSPLICQGTWEGFILRAPQGQGGFGYDPVFGLLPEKQSAAELSLEQKNRLSHRGQALSLLFAQLKARLVQESPR